MGRIRTRKRILVNYPACVSVSGLILGIYINMSSSSSLVYDDVTSTSEYQSTLDSSDDSSISMTRRSGFQSDFESSDFTTASTGDSTCTSSADEDWSESSSEASKCGNTGPIASRVRQDLSPLYEGAKITFLESLVLLIRFSLVHALSKRAFEELLRLVSNHLPGSTTSIPRSVYSLKKAFVQNFPHVAGVKIPYCSNCQALLQGGCTCGRGACSTAACDYFIYVPLAQQLKAKLEDASKLCTCICVHVHVYMYMYVSMILLNM